MTKEESRKRLGLTTTRTKEESRKRLDQLVTPKPKPKTKPTPQMPSFTSMAQQEVDKARLIREQKPAPKRAGAIPTGKGTPAKRIPSNPLGASDKTKIERVGIGTSLLRAAEGAAESITLGAGLFNKARKLGAFLGEKTVKPSTPEQLQRSEEFKRNLEQEQIKREQSTAYKVGEIAGYTVPGMGASKVSSKLLSPVFKSVPKLSKARGAISEVVAGVGLGVAEGLVRGEGVKETARRSAEYGALGGALGGVFDVSSPLLKNIRQAKQLKKIDKGYQHIADEFIPKKVPETPSFIREPAEQFGKTIPEATAPVKVASGIPEAPSFIQEASAPKTEPMKVKAPIKFESIKTVDQLPKSREGLEEYVRQAQSKKDKGFKINLQLFAEAEKRLKQSKFATNTIPKTYSDEATKEALWEADFGYEVIPNQKSLEDATEMLSKDYEGTYKKIINQAEEQTGLTAADTQAGTLIAKDLEREALKTKDFSKFTNFLEQMRKPYTQMGQAIQALYAGQSKTAIDKISKVQGVFKSIIEDAKKTNKKVAGFDTEIKDIKNVVKGKRNKAIDDAIDSLDIGSQTDFGKNIKDRVSSYIKPKGTKEKGLVREMLDEIFGEAKTVVKQGAKVIKQEGDDIRMLSDTYKYKSWAKDIRTKAQQYLKEEFKDSQEMLKVLDDYFKLDKAPINKDIINKVLKNRLTGLRATGEIGTKTVVNKQNIKEWVKDWYSTGKESSEEFINKIVRETNLSGYDAQLLKNTLENTILNQRQAIKEDLLNKMITPKTTPKQRSAIEKLIEKINIGVYDESLDYNISNLIKEKYGLPYLSDADTEFIVKAYDDLARLDPNSRAYKELTYDINTLISSKLPSDMVQKYAAVQRLDFLTNLKSVLKSITNISKGGEYLTAQITEPALDALTTGFKKYILKNPNAKRELYFPTYNDIKGTLKAFGKGAKETLTDIKKYKDTSRMQNLYSDKFIRTRPFSESNVGGRLLNRIDFTTGKLYELFDRPFTEAMYEGRMRQLMRAKGINKATPEITEEAMKYAEEMMGVSDSALAQLINRVKRFSFGKDREALNKSYQMTMQYFLPFVRFMSNDAVRSIQYTGSSIFEGIYHLTKGNQKEALKNFNRAGYGTLGLTGLGIILAKNGFIPKQIDDRKAEYLKKEIGEKPKSVKVGNKTYDISWMGSASMPILQGARIYYDSENKDNILDQFLEYTKAPFNPKYYETPLESSLNLGPAQKIKRILMAEDKGEELVYGTARDLVGMTSPTIVKQTASYLDPYERETIGATKKEQIVNEFKKGVPKLRETLAPKSTMLGEKQESYFKGLSSFVDIFNTANIKNDRLLNELNRLVDAGYTDQVPAQIPKSITTEKKNKIIFTAKDRSAYGMIYGKYLKKEMLSKLNNPEYKKVSDLEKADALQRAISSAKKQAIREFAKIKNK